LARSNLSLTIANMMLRRGGYEPVGITYPSRHRSLGELAEYVHGRLPEFGDRRIHFLTHSMGGLVTRRLLREHRPENLGRVVMLAPPNKGSQLASRLRDSEVFRWVMGPAAQQLGAGTQQVEELVGPVDFELGVITGDRPLALFKRLLHAPHDGRVSVDEARIEGMADFLVVPRGHAFIMNDPVVIRQAMHFFENGRFERR
jgi:pimeloyl-ACP methyl ester carboxylesterase